MDYKSTVRTGHHMAEPVKVLDKALDILELLGGARDFVTAQRISEEVNLPKSTVHRILNTLVARGYVRKDERAHAYAVGLKVLQLKELTLDDLHLVNAARPILRSLADATGCTAHLAILTQDTASYVDHWVGPSGLAIRTRLGEHAPLYCTSLGKALLAWLPPDQLEATLHRLQFEARTPHTITTVERLRQELETVRRQGFAEDIEESMLGVRCIGAPVRGNDGRVVAAISITTLAAQLNEAKRLACIPLVRQHAEQLSAELGHSL